MLCNVGKDVYICSSSIGHETGLKHTSRQISAHGLGQSPPLLSPASRCAPNTRFFDTANRVLPCGLGCGQVIESKSAVEVHHQPFRSHQAADLQCYDLPLMDDYLAFMTTCNNPSLLCPCESTAQALRRKGPRATENSGVLGGIQCSCPRGREDGAAEGCA